MRSEVPETWGKVKLGQVCIFQNGKKPVEILALDEDLYSIYGGNGKYASTNNHNSENVCVVGRVGAYCGSVYHEKEKCWVSDNAIQVFVEDENLLDVGYLYNVLVGARLNKMQIGTSQPLLTQGILKAIEINLPPLPVQKAIADTLSCLDAKIEANSKINENLETQAQAIFKSWFVDFEPFQDGAFVDSELGLIPKGWHITPLSRVVVSTIAGDWGKAELEGNYTEKVYCVRGADIPDVQRGDKGKMPTRYILSKNLREKRLQRDNLVVEISGGSPTQSTGRIVRISDYLLNRYDADMVCTNFCRALSVEQPFSSFLYRYWLYVYNLGMMFGYENGTTGIKNFDLESFLRNTLIALPPLEIAEQYNEITRIFEKAVYRYAQESEVLSTLRDTLLPKLMSGEIEVPVD